MTYISYDINYSTYQYIKERPATLLRLRLTVRHFLHERPPFLWKTIQRYLKFYHFREWPQNFNNDNIASLTFSIKFVFLKINLMEKGTLCMLAIIEFDTLTYANELQKVGFTGKQAEVQAKTLKRIIDSNLATKQDILMLQKDIAETKGDLQKEISETKAALQKDIAETKSDLQKEISETKAALQKDIAETKGDLQKEISETKAALQKDIEKNAQIAKQDILMLQKDIAETKGDLQKEIAETKGDLQKEIAETKAGIIKWVAGMLLAQSAVVATLVKLL